MERSKKAKYQAALIVALALIASTSYGQRINETKDEARQRQQAEQYQQYQDRGYQQPLGGYQNRLGDPPQRPLSNDAYGGQQPQQYGQPYRFNDDQ